MGLYQFIIVIVIIAVVVAFVVLVWLEDCWKREERKPPPPFEMLLLWIEEAIEMNQVGGVRAAVSRWCQANPSETLSAAQIELAANATAHEEEDAKMVRRILSCRLRRCGRCSAEIPQNYCSKCGWPDTRNDREPPQPNLTNEHPDPLPPR